MSIKILFSLPYCLINIILMAIWLSAYLQDFSSHGNIVERVLEYGPCWHDKPIVSYDPILGPGSVPQVEQRADLVVSLGFGSMSV